jgi:hypothetical protein
VRRSRSHRGSEGPTIASDQGVDELFRLARQRIATPGYVLIGPAKQQPMTAGRRPAIAGNVDDLNGDAVSAQRLDQRRYGDFRILAQ